MSKKKKKTEKSIHKNLTNKQPIISWLPTAVFITAGILIFYPPYFQGLFFPREMFITHIITALVFTGVWVQKIINKDFSFIKTPLDWAVLAYAGAYLLSLIGAVHIGEATYGFLKALNYFMVYWIITQLVKNYKDYENVMRILLASAAGVAVIGILAAAGLSDFPGAFDKNTIRSTLQYSNAAAAYLAVMSLIGLTLWIREKHFAMKIIFGAVTFILMLVALAAASKGAWLIFMVGALLFFIIMPGEYRIKSIYNLLAALLITLAISTRYIPAISQEQSGSNMLLVLMGILLVMCAQGLWELISRMANKLEKKYAVTATLAVVLLASGIFAYYAANHTEMFISEETTKEISGLADMENTSFTSRMDFNRWALAIVKDYPVSGAGAGGWNALYHQYADKLVWTTEVHNHFLQVWVEAGTIGILAVISIWVLFLMAVYRIYRARAKDDTNFIVEQKVLVLGSSIAASALGLHAAIDFDLSMPALVILLWILFALVRSAGIISNAEYRKTTLEQPVINTTLASVMALVLLICGSSYALADNYARKGQDSIKIMMEAEAADERTAELTKAESNYKKAINLDSCNAAYHANMAQIDAIIFKQTQASNPEVAQKYRMLALDELDKCHELAPYDLKVRKICFNSSIQMGDINETIKQAKYALTANPWDNNAYNAAAGALWAGTDYYLQQKDYDKSRTYAGELTNVQNKIQGQIAKLQLSRNASQAGQLGLSFDSKLNIGKAYYILGDLKTAESTLKPMINNLLAMEFADISFESIELENENWRVTVVKDKEASNGKCLQITAKQDMHGWPAVLYLGTNIPVVPGKEYITEIRYKVIKSSNSPNGREGGSLGIWGKSLGEKQSQNTSFTFFNGEKDVNDISSWKVSQQVLKHGDGFDKRIFFIGTGSVCKETQFRIDYVAFYPTDITDLPDNMKTATIFFAAALNQQGKEEQAVQALEGLQYDTNLMELYSQLITISN